MSRALNDLDPIFRPKAIELLARAVEAGIQIMIVETSRTEAEQAEYVASGHSWTMRSRHLVGKAIDIAPFETFQLHGADKLQWNTSDPVWAKLGDIGKRLGLIWGGDWKQRDMGHFESRL